MLAVSVGRTTLTYGHKHYCNLHKTFVDLKHANRCCLVNELGDVDKYNGILEK